MLICFGLWILGLTISFLIAPHPPAAGEPVIISAASGNHASFLRALELTLSIFTHNMMVALVISVAGYLTGGILTIIGLIWNGFLIGTIMETAFVNHLTILQILLGLIHAPFEIGAFLWFGALGLKGLQNLNRVLHDQPVTLRNHPKPKEFVMPSILMTVAAVIESVLIVLNV